MRDVIQSGLRFSWAMSLLGINQLARVFPGVPPNSASQTRPDGNFPSQTPNAEVSSFNPATGMNGSLPNSGSLNTSRCVVLGEGLAAGVGDFTLSAESQVWSFPAQMARQMSADIPQRLIQAPGIGNFVGFSSLPVRIPAPLQTTVFDLPPAPVKNLAVPELRLEDTLELHPRQPLIHRNDAKQTAVNLTWGLLPITQGQDFLPTQLEYALQQSPTFAIVELGYYEAVEAAIRADMHLLPEQHRFASNYSRILSALRNIGADVLILTIPSPLDTAFFSTIEVAARLARLEPAFLLERYGMSGDDLVTLNGLNEIGFQIFKKSLAALSPGSILSRSIADRIRSRIEQLNTALANLAEQHGAVVYDLAALFRRVASAGYWAGTKHLTGEYLGGFYSLNGYYPGQTGQAIIANEVLQLLNSAHGSTFAPVDLTVVVTTDPAAACKQAAGALWPTEDLRKLPFSSQPELDSSRVNNESDFNRRFSVDDNWQQLAPVTPPAPPQLPLQLPPGLEQVLPLNSSASYFGDGISALNVRNPQQAKFGSTANFIFGGLAMVDSHLTGSIKLKFTPPVNNVSHFEISFLGGFEGQDAVLATPQFFKMGFQKNRVGEFPGMVSSGDLDLSTGEVSNLAVYAQYSSTALRALVSVNPTFPKPAVIVFKNPPPSNCPPPTPEQQQIYASSWARFERRDDGKLDFTFYGSMFVPLGPGIVWPLNFVGPDGQFATIPAAGTVMHPHLSLSTRELDTADTNECPDIPFNTVQEFTLFTHNSAFGDAFHLGAPHLGGPAKGRSHLLGRLQVQFGSRTGNSVPVAIWTLQPGGIMAPLPASPITAAFPSQLSPGPQGFNEFLRFPLRTYPLDDLSIVEDPFDICIGSIDLKSGRLLSDLLNRAFISQDLIFALLRVEPCTPQSSFFFRGPARFVRGPRNERVFRFQGIVHIPYPEGFKFPNPDFATGFTVKGNSALDPFLWLHGIQNGAACNVTKQGGADHIRSSTGDEFSFRYMIPPEPWHNKTLFEYENHSQEGKFRMHSLAWIDFFNAGTSTDAEQYDTVTFSGFGVWTKDGASTLQQVAVQISTAPSKNYVGIQVAAGDVSNVNTKPKNEQAALP